MEIPNAELGFVPVYPLPGRVDPDFREMRAMSLLRVLDLGLWMPVQGHSGCRRPQVSVCREGVSEGLFFAGAGGAECVVRT